MFIYTERAFKLEMITYTERTFKLEMIIYTERKKNEFYNRNV